MTSPPFARRIRGLVQSDIRRMSRECAAVDGINLGQGICDQPVEEVIKRATIEAIEADRSTYSPFEGIPELRRKIAGKMLAYNGIDCDPETEVLVNVGSTGSFVIACLALLEPGDEVVLFTPFYGYHRNILALCEARIRFVETRPPDWSLDDEELAAAFSDRTKLVIVNTPANPSGKVFRRGELERIAEMCVRHDAYAVTDEIYEYILYGDARHVSLGSLSGMRDRTITISGLSKTYSMTGWRLGYAVCNAVLAERLGVLNDLLYICAPTPLQHGVVPAFDLPEEYYRDMKADYARKLERLAAACRDIGMEPLMPQGAYYLLADLGRFPADDGQEAARLLIQRARVAAVPGASFYPDAEAGRRRIRFCFAKTDEDLQEACNRMRDAFG
ncbi:MAG: pyridoxal phosphate-dependent aminotransferase [Acidobacteriota bacterium]|jgi:aminotransferase